jgi:hypothetical protein
MKPKRSIKRRKRLEGQIAKEAQTNVNAALELARYGRHPTPMEKEVWTYLSDIECGKRFGLKQPFPAIQAGRLCRLFLDAVRNREGNTLRNMARAVENFQSDSPPVDELRKDILILKARLDHSGEKMTFKDACIALNRRLGIPALDEAILNGSISGDGTSSFLKVPDSTLRHYLKTLHFPLAKERTGRPKKSAK